MFNVDLLRKAAEAFDDENLTLGEGTLCDKVGRHCAIGHLLSVAGVPNQAMDIYEVHLDRLDEELRNFIIWRGGHEGLSWHGLNASVAVNILYGIDVEEVREMMNLNDMLTEPDSRIMALDMRLARLIRQAESEVAQHNV